MNIRKKYDYNSYDFIIIGSGFSGTISARLLAENGLKVLIIEKKREIGGMMTDYHTPLGTCVHKYGPHILMLNSNEVYDYLSRFCSFSAIEVKVNAFVNNKYISIPVNLKSIHQLYSRELAIKIENKLISVYGKNTKINILDLQKSKDALISYFSNDIYNKIFVGYNAKMWGVKPDELDPSIPGRLPIRINYDTNSNEKKIKVIPKGGYSKLFANLLTHQNIDIELGKDALSFLKFDFKSNIIHLNNREYTGKIIYTAPLDSLFLYKYGHLPFRSLNFKFRKKEEYKKDSAVTTFPNIYRKTRTTNINKLLAQKVAGEIVTIDEYPGEFNEISNRFHIPSYPMINKKSKIMIKMYADLANDIPGFYYAGRLSEFKYYDMESSILNAMKLVTSIINER